MKFKNKKKDEYPLNYLPVATIRFRMPRESENKNKGARELFKKEGEWKNVY